MGQAPPRTPDATSLALDRISIEVTNACAKACDFCYNHSHAGGATVWTPDELVAFVEDCARHGVKAVSFGGGEPLQVEWLFEVLSRLRGALFRSVTTNGLLLKGEAFDRLIEAAPDKVHVSVHFPDRRSEVDRVIKQVHALAEAGVASGLNFLVRRRELPAAVEAAAHIRASGIDNRRIVYLPMRGADTPTPEEIGQVAGSMAFQSMSCLMACAASPRFCSITWDKRVAWCSYTVSRHPLSDLTFASLAASLDGLGLTFCG